MFRWREALPVCVVAITALLAHSAMGCGGGKPPATPDKAAAANGGGKAGDWCNPMPEPDQKCSVELKECMVTCDYISDRCALVVCMGSKWTYVEEEDESADKK
jgi:hypothetical protein